MRLLLLVLIAALFAGCSEAPEEPEAQDDFENFDGDLTATDTTGVIRGVVVNEAVVPIAGVLVEVDGQGLQATTDENGLFGFDGLEAGTYFLALSKIGHVPVQTGVDVVAGESAPPVLRVRMLQDLENQPYSATTPHRGYYQCGLSFVVVCGAPNVLTGDQVTEDTSTHTFYFERQPTYVQSEMSWETTQTVSPDLRLEVETIDNCTGPVLIGNVLGPSPLRIMANETQLQEHGVIGECGLYHSVFAGDVLEQAHCGFWDPVPLLKCGVGFSIEQSFEWFVTEFHGYTPPEDWWYITDGPLAPPA